MSAASTQPRPNYVRDGRAGATVADMLESLGNVPATRVLLHPSPGTATESDLLHEIEQNDRLVELVDHTLVEKGMGAYEDVVSLAVAATLRSFVTERRLGIVGGAQSPLRMRSSNVRLPDAYFISADRLPGGVVPRDAVFTIGLDLAIEVLSSGNTPQEMLQKRQEYFATGAQQVWEIDPTARTFAVYTSPDTHTTLTATDTLTGGTLLPGFELPLARLWQEIDHPLGK